MTFKEITQDIPNNIFHELYYRNYLYIEERRKEEEEKRRRERQQPKNKSSRPIPPDLPPGTTIEDLEDEFDDF